MLILGHRGANIRRSTNPAHFQNSLSAFKEALDAADGFETDACLSAYDGTRQEIFLIHEANDNFGIIEHLNSTSAAMLRQERLHNLAPRFIESFHLRNGESIPTLQQALTLVGQQAGKVINIELKGYGVADPVMRLLKQNFAKGTIKPEAITLSSFHHEALFLVRLHMPDIKLGALVVSDSESGKPLFSYHEDPGTNDIFYVGLTDAVASPIMPEINPDFFVMPEKLLTLATIEKIGAAFPKAQLCGWTVSERNDYDQEDLLNRLAELRSSGKIGAMIVDDPRGFKEAYQQKFG